MRPDQPNPLYITPNVAASPLRHGQNFYQHWQNLPSVVQLSIGTVIEVKSLGQTIRDQELKERLEAETLLSAEEIPIYACDVLSMDGRRYNNCQMVFPYVHNSPGLNGAGIYFVPEEGAQVILAHVQGQPFILGFINAVDKDEAGFRNGKEPLIKGSYCLKTSDQNKIVLHKGGIITIQNTPACYRQYISVRDQIRDLCQNYFMTTEGGGIAWEKEPQQGLHTNLRWIMFDHPKNLPEIFPNSVLIDAGQDPKTPELQHRSLYNILVQDKDEILQARFNIRPNGFIDIDVKNTRDPADPEYGPEAGCIDIDADEYLDLTAKNTIRIGTTQTDPAPVMPPADPKDYPSRDVDHPHADFGGSPQQTTDFINVTCEIDVDLRVGENKNIQIGINKNEEIGADQIQSVGGNVQRTIGDKNDFSAGGTAVMSVSGFWHLLAGPIHLNPSSQLSGGSITSGITSAGAISMVGAPGASLWTDTIDVWSEGFGAAAGYAPVTLTDVVGGTNLQYVIPGGNTYTTANSDLAVMLNSTPLIEGTEYTKIDNKTIEYIGTTSPGDIFEFDHPDLMHISGIVPSPDGRPLPGDPLSGAFAGSSAAGLFNQPSFPDVNDQIRNAVDLYTESVGPGNDMVTPGFGATVTGFTPIDV